jgi:HSP20 family molecular chaperone IbpA
VDVIEDGQGLTLWADLPGVPKDKLQLRVEGQTLSIDAEVDLGPREGYSAHHVEARRTRYERQFTLSRELDATQVAAEFKQGVLQVRIAKVAQARARKIDVQVH